MADDHRWEDWFRSGSHPDSFAHPDSPAGGSGTGFSRPPGPQRYSWPSSSSVPHPDSPAGRCFSGHTGLPHLLFEERARAVYQALVSAPKYVPGALYEATGQELHSFVSGIIPGLLMFMGVLAASTALGAAAGAAIGGLAFGVGAAPGAAVGAELGFDAGIALLGYLGLAFLVGYIGKSLLQGATAAGEAVTMAWHSVDNRTSQRMAVDRAAYRLAFAVGLVFRGVLQGIVAYLLAKGTAAAASRVPELVSKLRASKLGAGFAQWIEKNWKGLIEEPKLRDAGEGKGTGGGVGESESAPPKNVPPKSVPSRRSQTKEPLRESKSKSPAPAPARLAEGFAERARPAEVRTAQRLAENPEFHGRTFDAPPPPDPGYDWKDDLGRTYDAMGDGTKSRFFNLQQFTSSIDSHLLKSNDFTVIDMTGYTPEQVAAVGKYVDGLPFSSQALVRKVGF